jgi:hypothetical protein
MKTTKSQAIVLVLALVGCLLFIVSSVYAQRIDSLDYKNTATGSFKAKLKASGLVPNHTYQITLNGYKNHPSNKVLLTYQNYDGEGYIDFKKVSTDDKGVLTTEIDRKLPKGQYRIKVLVKDPEKNWRVVASEDFVEFEVK